MRRVPGTPAAEGRVRNGGGDARCEPAGALELCRGEQWRCLRFCMRARPSHVLPVRCSFRDVRVCDQGRESFVEELREIAETKLQRHTPPVVMLGNPGAGKTSALAYFFHLYRDQVRCCSRLCGVICSCGADADRCQTAKDGSDETNAIKKAQKRTVHLVAHVVGASSRSTDVRFTRTLATACTHLLHLTLSCPWRRQSCA